MKVTKTKVSSEDRRLIDEALRDGKRQVIPVGVAGVVTFKYSHVRRRKRKDDDEPVQVSPDE